MPDFEVPQPIICSPFREPDHHWQLQEGVEPLKAAGRRPAAYFYREPGAENAEGDATGSLVELALVNLIRARVTTSAASDRTPIARFHGW
jgi:type III restriction enzyme